MVVRNLFLLLLDSSAWPCHSPALQILHIFLRLLRIFLQLSLDSIGGTSTIMPLMEETCHGVKPGHISLTHSLGVRLLHCDFDPAALKYERV